MAQGKTLWQMFMDKVQGPVELQFYNPLKARVGSAIMLNEVERRDLNFFVREIRENRRSVGGQEFLFTDYLIAARPLNREEVKLRVRVYPAGDREQEQGQSHHALVLSLDDDLAYDDGLHRVVTDNTKKFQVLQDGEVQEEFFRINDLTDSWKTRVAIIKDLDKDGTAEQEEVQRIRIEYWDYWREVKDAAGQPLIQYLFVEMDAATGWFQIWKGEEIDPQRVLVV